MRTIFGTKQLSIIVAQLTVPKKMATCTVNHNSLRVVNIISYRKKGF